MNYISSYPSTVIFYLLLLIFCVALSYIAAKKDNKAPRIFVLLVIILLTAVAGFRGITVGVDTERYIEVIMQIEYMVGTYRIKATEMGYVYYVLSLTTIINSPQIVLFVSALITNGLIIIRLWSFKQKISFSFAVFLYISIYYILTFNTMRQWIAISIVFFGVKYLFEEKYFRFSVLVIIASTFHTTSLISLLLIPIFLLYKKNESIKSYNKLLFSLILSPILILGSLLIVLSTSVISQYSNYFKDPDLEFSLSWFVRVLIVLFIILILNPKKNQKYDGSEDVHLKEQIEFYKIIRTLTVMGLILRSLGLFYDYTYRIGLYFSFFEIILFSMVIKFKNFGLFLRIIIIILAVIIFYTAMKNSGYGQIPYIPFWRD